MLELVLAAVLGGTAVSTVIVDVAIVYPETNSVQLHQNVEFAGDQIVSISTKAPGRRARKIDGKRKFLIPGLWDMHVHWYDKPTLNLFTANGVTGIREMFGTRELLGWRDAIDAGKMIGPRMVVGSPIVDGPKPFWTGSLAAGTEAEGRAALRQVKKAGYDFVKVYSFLPPPAYFGIMDEAKKLNFPADGHVPHRISVSQAAQAGHRCAEHLYGFGMSAARREDEFRRATEKFAPRGPKGIIDAYWYMEDAIAASLDLEKEQAIFAQIKAADMYHCPTLVVLHAGANHFDPAFRKHPHIAYMFKSAIDSFWQPPKSPDLKQHLALERKAFQRSFELLKRMHKAGVRLVAGTDVLNPYTFPGFSLHDELRLFVQAGMTPAEALCTATSNPARMLNKQATMGSVRVGAVADLVLLDANPLADIKNTTRINAVVQRGRVFDRAEIDSIKSRARVYFKKN
jgi:hypothetical protein